ncbi:ABC transporter permease subunit [Lederbergia lenta]|uniref:ABC-type transport system involved in multi-copper enzyme maturation, permease component n=1 Tax=Lederbergia lenta TaxID=1467 RepID=A0A2X4Z132_LEDLE|nr:ABC transporter permease subunit [Lederbergia lenta]MEC2325554.1 ABC transporter permease subunit [Lederbergia lenta]SQI54334.1 ABC-type transport system involved in multi-copper enzyme maturation, permease component [Lederbergia lenta]
MRQLLKFELYKIYRQKSIYILFGVLMLIISLGLYMDRESEQANYLVYKQWEGEITADKLAYLDKEIIEIEKKMESGIETPQERLLYGISESFAYQLGNAHKHEKRIADLTAIINTDSTSYKERAAELEKNMLSKINMSKFYYDAGPAQIIDMIYTFGFVITAFLIIIGIAPILSNEYSSGMDQFLLSSKYGRSKAITSKIIASVIFTLSVITGWVALNTAVSVYTYGFHGWKAPLQSMFQHYFAPYPITLGEAYPIMISMHLLAALGFTLIVICVSAICKRGLLSLLVSGFIFGVPFAIDVVFEDLENIVWLNKLLKLSIYQCMKVKEQFVDFSTYNVFGFPVLYPVVTVLLSVITAIIFSYLTKWIMKRKQVTI